MEARELAVEWRKRFAPDGKAGNVGAATSAPGSTSVSAASQGVGASNRNRIPPPAVCNTALLRAMYKDDYPDEAWSWFRETLHAVEDTVARGVTAAASAYPRANETSEQGGDGFRDGMSLVPGLELALDRASFVTVLTGCSRASRWEEAMRVLHHMERVGYTPDTSAYNVALSGEVIDCFYLWFTSLHSWLHVLGESFCADKHEILHFPPTYLYLSTRV